MIQAICDHSAPPVTAGGLCCVRRISHWASVAAEAFLHGCFPAPGGRKPIGAASESGGMEPVHPICPPTAVGSQGDAAAGANVPPSRCPTRAHIDGADSKRQEPRWFLPFRFSAGFCFVWRCRFAAVPPGLHRKPGARSHGWESEIKTRTAPAGEDNGSGRGPREIQDSL